MSETGAFGEELADFVRRVAELRSARALPPEEQRGVLDAALFELQHAAETLWPRYERLAARAPEGTSAERQERQLLKTVFQRLPLPVVLIDRDTVVRRMNLAATTLTGVRAGYATGRPLAALLTPGDRAPFRSQVAATARGEGGRSLTVRLQQRPKEPVRATLAALALPGEPQQTVLLVLQPGVAGAGPNGPAGVGRRMAADPAGRREAGGAAGAEPPGPGGGFAGPGGTGAGFAGPGGAVRGRRRLGGAPDLVEATERAAALDLVDTVATTLLRTPPADARGAVEAAARVLHGRFADWVIADLTAAGDGSGDAGPGPGVVRRCWCSGRRTTPRWRRSWPRRTRRTAPWCGRSRRAARPRCRCAPRTRWPSARTPAGRPCSYGPRSVRCCAFRWPPMPPAPGSRGCWPC
ncbi:PAS domain-containing protein [Streptomyces sp. SudanB25_2051]|uniref:PAS domain-containing protein n=1 Tax=Streptomyces sp. SudanB25_2051 TaxID=3035275 RepID=UPI003F546E6D